MTWFMLQEFEEKSQEKPITIIGLSNELNEFSGGERGEGYYL